MVLNRSLASCEVDLRLGLCATTKNRRYWKISLVKLLDFSQCTSCLEGAQKLSNEFLPWAIGKSVTYNTIQPVVACSLFELLVCPKFKGGFSHNDIIISSLSCLYTVYAF